MLATINMDASVSLNDSKGVIFQPFDGRGSRERPSTSFHCTGGI